MAGVEENTFGQVAVLTDGCEFGFEEGKSFDDLTSGTNEGVVINVSCDSNSRELPLEFD